MLTGTVRSLDFQHSAVGAGGNKRRIAGQIAGLDLGLAGRPGRTAALQLLLGDLQLNVMAGNVDLDAPVTSGTPRERMMGSGTKPMPGTAACS